MVDRSNDSVWGRNSRLPQDEERAGEIPTPSAEERCLGCGEETAAGSIFFSDRRETTISDGTRVFLCSECQAKAHLARKGQPLTDEDLRAIAKNGMVIGVGFLGGGGLA